MRANQAKYLVYTSCIHTFVHAHTRAWTLTHTCALTPFRTYIYIHTPAFIRHTHMQIFQNESKFMGQISISKGFLMWKNAFPGRWVMWRSPASREDRQRLKVGGAGGTPARMCNPVKNEWPGANSRLSWSNMLLISGSLLSLFPLETLWSPETGVVRNWAHLPKCQWDFPEEKAFRISLPGLLCAAHFIRTVGSEQRCPEFLSFWLSTLPFGSHYPLRGRHQNRHLTPWNGGREAALLAWTTSVEQQPCLKLFRVFPH